MCIEAARQLERGFCGFRGAERLGLDLSSREALRHHRLGLRLCASAAGMVAHPAANLGVPSAASSMRRAGPAEQHQHRGFRRWRPSIVLTAVFRKAGRLAHADHEQIAFDAVGEVATMTMLAGECEPLNSSFFYVKWVRPLGFRDVIGVLVLKSGKRVAWFSVARSDLSQSQFDDTDLRQMELLSPHILPRRC